MKNNFGFQHLHVWQGARSITKEVYTLTSSFPDNERYGMTSQLRRAAVSICCNIAEGSGRKTSADQKHFYVMAKASLLEVMNLVILSNDLDFFSTEKMDYLFEKGKKLEVNIGSLIRSR